MPVYSLHGVAPRLSFLFVSNPYFLEEVAKFRAARRMWSRVMQERFGSQKEQSLMLRLVRRLESGEDGRKGMGASLSHTDAIGAKTTRRLHLHCLRQPQP